MEWNGKNSWRQSLTKIHIRKKRTFQDSKDVFNDEKKQQTLFPKKEEWYITTPKFERLREKLLKKQKEKENLD